MYFYFGEMAYVMFNSCTNPAKRNSEIQEKQAFFQWIMQYFNLHDMKKATSVLFVNSGETVL